MPTLLSVTATPIFTLTLNKTLVSLPKPYSLSYKFNSLVSHCSLSQSDEDRWLREEQRWLREEQRWLREEQRWARERDQLLREISDLKLQIHRLSARALSTPASVSDAVANAALLLQVLKDKNIFLESGSSVLKMEDVITHTEHTSKNAEETGTSDLGIESDVIFLTHVSQNLLINPSP